eukprot:TRINITY_DN44574_c0_g1_i1.p1 TRINITY_DN44574_c0_g1~~TRINITY_DN44574_c0_g1_i1.p1  ORF type:complete len:266 (-),score=31.23 TRINITY_DN44574_c0_g1_i1:133-930(-)
MVRSLLSPFVMLSPSRPAFKVTGREYLAKNPNGDASRSGAHLHPAGSSKYNVGVWQSRPARFRYPFGSPLARRFPFNMRRYIAEAPFSKRQLIPTPGKAEMQRIAAEGPRLQMRSQKWPYCFDDDAEFPDWDSESNAWSMKRDYIADLCRRDMLPWTSPWVDGDERTRHGLVTVEVASHGGHLAPDLRRHQHFVKINRAVPGLQKRHDEARVNQRLRIIEEQRLARVAWQVKAEKYLAEEGVRSELFTGGLSQNDVESEIRAIRR